MKLQAKIIYDVVLLFLIVVALSAANCNKLRSAAQAAYDLDQGIATLQNIVEKSNLSGTLLDESYLKVLYAERDVTKANKEYRDQLIGIKQIDPVNKLAIISSLSATADALDRLAQAGTLHIKDPNKLKEISTVIGVAKTSISTLQIFLSKIQSPVIIPAGTFK